METSKLKKFWAEFKAFAMRGNVLDMAVGVVIGSAFTAIVNSLVGDIISPVIGLFFNADFSRVGITIGDVTIGLGAFLNAVINFLIVAFVLFVVLKVFNARCTKSQPRRRLLPSSAPTVSPPSPSRRCAARIVPPSWRAGRKQQTEARFFL